MNDKGKLLKNLPIVFKIALNMVAIILIMRKLVELKIKLHKQKKD